MNFFLAKCKCLSHQLTAVAPIMLLYFQVDRRLRTTFKVLCRQSKIENNSVILQKSGHNSKLYQKFVKGEGNVES